jgi:Flp pilus assembly protein TadG
MRSLIRSAHRRDEGAVAVLVALMLTVFVAMVALAVDAGGLYLRRRELVNGSDSAALSAGRTCARGGLDDRFASPEEAADFHVRQNGQITAAEVSGVTPNIIDMTSCGLQWGHVTVQYTSEQSLFFAPAVGFNSTSPVTTTATASWGLGSNNPVPIVLSTLISDRCAVPPTGWPSEGQICSFWYDNDRLDGGNFAFLSLNPAGWDVPIDGNCSGAQSGGTDNLTKWIDGSLPASVTLNWLDPTYVCTDTGIRGVGGKTGPNARVWSALHDLIGETRDFPINWEGPGRPVPAAPEQGMVFQSGNIDKFDIIGFASMEIVDVLGRDETEGGIGSCATKNNSPFTWNATGQTLNLNTISDQTSGWQGCPTRTPDQIIGDPVVTKAKNPDPACCTPGVDYSWDATTRTITWLGTQLPKETKITFNWEIDPNNGPCGVLPPNGSAMCVITVWHGSTLDPDFPAGTDNNTVIRLCDFAYGTCLDQ